VNLDAIRAETARANVELDGRPLPLAASWQMGDFGGGTARAGPGPIEQRELLASGHYWLPGVAMPMPGTTTPYHANEKVFRRFVRELADAGLPFTIAHTQLENALRSALWPGATWHLLPAATTGMALALDGTIHAEKRVDPLGPVGLWREIGAGVLRSEPMDWMQTAYPDPPRVVWLSNNEAEKLSWVRFHESKRYVDLYGSTSSMTQRAQVYVEAMRERTQAMNGTRRTGLAPSWREASMDVGFGVAAAPFFGRWDGWPEYLSYTPAQFYHGLGWDGGSQHEVYLTKRDLRMWSPYGQAMQLPFQDALTDAYRPRWWRETSVWHQTDEFRALHWPEGYTTDRYRGLVRWLLWMQRPRVLRQFEMWSSPNVKGWPWLSECLEAVREVHENDTLRHFWRLGTLVPEPSRPSPWSYSIPPYLAAEKRHFLLRTNAEELWDPAVYPTDWPVKVWAMALKLDGEWLLYVQSPGGFKAGVEVTIPERGVVKVDASQRGDFYTARLGGSVVRVA